jgi:hypothetical protein
VTGQHLYFHLNHPIRYVRVVGVVVAIDDLFERLAVVTVDDGSGATIELKIVRTPRTGPSILSTTSKTTIPNVEISSPFEVVVDSQCLDIGTVVKAKGTITEFRGIKQLDLKRLWVVSTTNEEVQAWTETAAFKLDVLSKPWHITAQQHKQIKEKIKSDKRKVQEYERRKAEHEAKKTEKLKEREAAIKRRESRMELRRKEEEKEMNRGALI